ncbi:MAG: DinB family protein [Ignavibacteriaceae bacterium]
MYRKISDFVDDWSYESEITLKLFNNLTDEILNKKFHENVRTAGRLSWHMINSIGEMVQRTGLDFEAEVDDTKIPTTSKEIYDAFKISSLNMLEAVKNNWNDSSLDEEVEMYGEMWKKGKVLSSLSKHNTHHRAELIVVMRLAGLKVVGPYGPSKEEWANYGMQPQE